jgi:hypothetical protein
VDDQDKVEERKLLAKAIVDEMINRLEIGVGKSIISTVVKWLGVLFFVIALYLYAQSHPLGKL